MFEFYLLFSGEVFQNHRTEPGGSKLSLSFLPFPTFLSKVMPPFRPPTLLDISGTTDQFSLRADSAPKKAPRSLANALRASGRRPVSPCHMVVFAEGSFPKTRLVLPIALRVFFSSQKANWPPKDGQTHQQRPLSSSFSLAFPFPRALLPS